MVLSLFAVALHAGDIQGIESQYQGLLRWVSLLVSSFVVMFSARPFFTTAWRHLLQGTLVMGPAAALNVDSAGKQGFCVVQVMDIGCGLSLGNVFEGGGVCLFERNRRFWQRQRPLPSTIQSP